MFCEIFTTVFASLDDSVTGALQTQRQAYAMTSQHAQQPTNPMARRQDDSHRMVGTTGYIDEMQIRSISPSRTCFTKLCPRQRVAFKRFHLLQVVDLILENVSQVESGPPCILHSRSELNLPPHVIIWIALHCNVHGCLFAECIDKF